ncbi:MAG TPA: serine/threonine-protein kinase, partial [Longimicrobium sp.]|nr:serine/threonine-protein kinase [Longimicrobium sp.]
MSSEAEDGGAAGAPGAENGDSSLKDPFLQAVAEALLPPSLELPDRVGSEGKFELREELGAGAMGRVFRARDLKLRRDVAIKFVLPVGGLSSGEMKALFRREARAVARLSHENIVRIFELDDSHDPPFIVMEHLEGRTLHDTLAQGRLSDAQVLDVMRQVSRGLSHAHRSGVFHRDLKPRNVFMCDGGTVKILDFGLAHLEQASTMRATWSSEASAPELPKAGTAAFMAPEQWRGEEIDARTDLWSAGVLLFRLLAGQLPYPTTEPGLLREQITSADAPPRVLDLRPDLPPGFGQVMARAMSKERRERYPNAEAFAADLEWLSRLLPTPGTRPGPPAPPRPSRSFWRERQLQNGLIHRVDENAEQVWKRMLLVFVQDASRAWGQVPEWLASRLGVDVNVLLFHPPLGSGEAMARAVTELGTALETRLSGVRHIVFFTHGDGLQLVRGLLARDAAAASGPGGAEEASRQARTFFRTRLLLHVSGALAT